MSKVVHLSEGAHRQAKEYCRVRDLKMSDWVATLIERATGERRLQTSLDGHDSKALSPTNLVAKKRVAGYEHVEPQIDEDGTPVYAAPPFWQRATTTH